MYFLMGSIVFLAATKVSQERHLEQRFDVVIENIKTGYLWPGLLFEIVRTHLSEKPQPGEKEPNA